jgi:aryl-alcohol dehydrogenase-like predicted oxidoreductase
MKVALGTAQFGLNYGISNSRGKTKSKEVKNILNYALSSGVNYLDTASIYGDSETVLGEVDVGSKLWSIVTKTPCFQQLNITQEEVLFLRSNFESSLDKLVRNNVYALLIHSVDDLFKKGGYMLFDEMLRLKEKGLIKKVGVSVYSSDEIYKVLERFPIDIIQLPISVLDQRLLSGGELALLKSKGVEIHARSIFLQGLLVMPLNEINPYFYPIMDKLLSFSNLALEQGLTKLELALNFVQSIDEVDKVIVGVNSLFHLKQILNVSHKRIINSDYKNLSCDNIEFINPALWKI